MSKSIYINVPTKDTAAARAFYTKLGFGINEQFSNEQNAFVVIDERITLMLGVRVREIDRAAKIVILEDARTVRYDTLVITTGGRGRSITLPGGDEDRAHFLRSIEDSKSISAVLARRTPLLIIGGGWIGLEAAAAAKVSARIFPTTTSGR